MPSNHINFHVESDELKRVKEIVRWLNYEAPSHLQASFARGQRQEVTIGGLAYQGFMQLVESCEETKE